MNFPINSLHSTFRPHLSIASVYKYINMSLDSAQLDEYLAFAIDLGKKAGEMIKDGQAKRFANKSTLDTKQNSIDVSMLPSLSAIWY